MSAEQGKRLAAEAALEHVEPGSVIGVGTGSTVDCFIDALGESRGRIEGAVASSEASAERLRRHRIEVLDLNAVGELPLYVDGADEANRFLQLIKGGGGAHTREKIVAHASRRFICIADDSKLVESLGAFPVAVEVLAMARSLVARELVKLGGRPVLREGFKTDNGHRIIDAHGLPLAEPMKMEQRINNIPGVVANGIFALRPADLLILGGAEGVRELHAA